MTQHTHEPARIMCHTDPVWRDRANLQIDVQIPGAADELERLFVRQTEENHYEVCCLPFALYDFNLGDVIEVEGSTTANAGTFKRVVKPSGRLAFRAILLDGGDWDRMRSLESTFLSMHCLTETYSPMMMAIDAEDERKGDWVLAVLEEVRDKKTLGETAFETVYPPFD